MPCAVTVVPSRARLNLSHRSLTTAPTAQDRSRPLISHKTGRHRGWAALPGWRVSTSSAPGPARSSAARNGINPPKRTTPGLRKNQVKRCRRSAALAGLPRRRSASAGPDSAARKL